MASKKPRIIKPGSLNLLRRLIVTELILIGVIATIAPLANYHQLYTEYVSWRLNFYRYDIIIIALVSLAQISTTLFVFISWEHELFSISRGEITYQRGILFVKETSFPLDQVGSITYSESPIQRYFHTGTIHLKSHQKRIFIIKNIDRARTWMQIIKELAAAERRERANQESDRGAEQLISAGEGSLIEFKRSLRWDYKLGAANRTLEKATLKSVAAFLNSDGGRLLIGVADNGEIAGLDGDYQSIQRGDRDGFENHFTQTFKAAIDVRFRRFVRLKFDNVNGQEICLIEVTPAPEPVFLKSGDSEEFYIRTGNTTSLLSLKQALDYINRHWA